MGWLLLTLCILAVRAFQILLQPKFLQVFSLPFSSDSILLIALPYVEDLQKSSV